MNLLQARTWIVVVRCLVVPFATILTNFAILPLPLAGAQSFDPFDQTFTQLDLTFPDQPRPFATGRESMMFKPEGPGPFPALVLMPACDGHNRSVHVFDWARRAIDHGYAALVVDPQTPRGVGMNCSLPLAINMTRLLKDAFDAASHLRRQAFVDQARVGLLGFSLGAMVGFGASDARYAERADSAQPFRAIVSIYPICQYKQIRRPGTSDSIDVRFVPEKIIVPILVEMGDQDNEGSPDGTVVDCKALLDPLKARGDPVTYMIYHATHEWDDRQLEQASQAFRKRGFNGQDIIYTYSASATEQSANDTFAFFERQLRR
jgi:dienelactone hydrolase